LRPHAFRPQLKRDPLGGPRPPLVLNDQEIHGLAEAHLRTRYGPHLPDVEPVRRLALVRQFELADPPGVYYTVRVLPKVEQPTSGHPFDDLLLGDGGFFVDRSTGAIRCFGSGEVFWTQFALAVRRDPVDLGGPGDGQSVVHFLLTHAPDAWRSLVPTSVHGARAKKWWQFWK